MPKAASSSLLNSLYLETLRLRTSVTVTRRLTADLEIGGYTLKKGHYVMAPSWLPHTSPDLWGDELPPLSSASSDNPKFFEPRRFAHIVPSALAHAGGKVDIPASSTPSNEKSTPSEKEAEENYSGRLRAALHPANFFPYGGGNAVCPGRFFSKVEIEAAVAVFVLMIELEITAGQQYEAQADERYAGGGVMPPVEDIVVRLKGRDVKMDS